MKDCESCKWDVKSESQNLRMIQCGQGHARTFQKIIKDCHAWGEKKEECRWCDEWRKLNITWHGTPFWKTLNYLINASDTPIGECPCCSKKFIKEN